jgi:outer membrane protease
MFHFPSFIYRQDGFELSVIIIGAKVVISSDQKNHYFRRTSNQRLMELSYSIIIFVE